MIDTLGVETRDGRCWTITIEHLNCACSFCSSIDARDAVHVYERRDDDLFVYRESLVVRSPR